jgi:YVTN family beta-propeller protein
MAAVFAVDAADNSPSAKADSVSPQPAAPVVTIDGMPPVSDVLNLYSEAGPNLLRADVKDDLERVYVPNLRADSVSVIDPATLNVIDRFKVGRSPQHIVPSWDMRTLWVANNAEGRRDGSLTPVDPRTGKPGKSLAVDDPYNLYFTPDGRSAIVVAEAKRRLDFRDPKTLQMQYSIALPKCGGVNHGDFSIDGKYAIFTCEFDGSVAKVDMVNKTVVGYLKMELPKTRFKDRPQSGNLFEPEICTSKKGMPQDIRIAPNGRLFYVADMEADGVHLVDGDTFKEIGFIATGVAAHGLYPSRDAKYMYVANRGSHSIHGKRKGPGSVTVIDFASNKVVANWPVPGGGSPDMGNVSANGRWLWLSGRFDDVVYRFDTSSGAVDQIAVGQEPHGLTVWPQPGRYSLGHTGNLR